MAIYAYCCGERLRALRFKKGSQGVRVSSESLFHRFTTTRIGRKFEPTLYPRMIEVEVLLAPMPVH